MQVNVVDTRVCCQARHGFRRPQLRPALPAEPCSGSIQLALPVQLGRASTAVSYCEIGVLQTPPCSLLHMEMNPLLSLLRSRSYIPVPGISRARMIDTRECRERGKRSTNFGRKWEQRQGTGGKEKGLTRP